MNEHVHCRAAAPRTLQAQPAGASRWFSRAVIALGIGLASFTSPAATAQPADVVIGVSSRSFNPGYSNMWIGIPLGLYGPTLAPKALGTKGASENLQLMLTGGVTMSTGVQDVVLNAMAAGQTIPAITPCVYLRGMIHQVAVAPDSPIKTFADLKGKRIGAPTLASTQVPYIKFAAKAAGVDPNSLNILAVGNGQQAAVALRRGDVDALVAADVSLSALKAAGVGLRILKQPDKIGDAAVAYVFAFNKNWYASHKNEAARLLQGMIKAIIVMLENPEAAVRISYHMHPEAIPSGVPFDKAVKNAIRSIKIRAPAIEREVSASNKWCEFPKAAWEKYVEIIGLKGKVDPMQFYTDELIDKINDFDEAALRKWARGLKVPTEPTEIDAWLKTVHPPQ